jgi:hypothetical protein
MNHKEGTKAVIAASVFLAFALAIGSFIRKL